MLFNIFGGRERGSQKSNPESRENKNFLGRPILQERKERDLFEIMPNANYAEALKIFQDAIDKANKDFELEAARKRYEILKENFSKRVIADYGGEKVVIHVLPGTDSAKLYTLWNDGNKLYNALMKAKDDGQNVTVEVYFSNRKIPLEIRPNDTIQWLMENRQQIERDLDSEDAKQATQSHVEPEDETDEDVIDLKDLFGKK